jgi:hypothetical protein
MKKHIWWIGALVIAGAVGYFVIYKPMKDAKDLVQENNQDSGAKA